MGMPRLRCPRCASVVEVAPGAAPVCSSCGFGAKAAPAAAPVQPSPPPAAPMAARTPAPAGSRRGAIIAICIVGFLVLAGAAAAVAYFALGADAPKALSQAEARSRVEASLQAAGDALSGQASDDDLRKVTVVAAPPESTPSGPEDFFSGLGQMTVTIEYGTADSVRFDLHMASGAVTVAFTMICTQDRQYMIAGGQAYASRPKVVDDPSSSCLDVGSGDEEDLMLTEGVPPLENLSVADGDIKRNSDGSVRAEIDEEGTHVVLEIGRDGRLAHVTATSPDDGSWEMTFEYGSRSSITPPKDFKLLPASVELAPVGPPQGATQTWTVVSSPEEPPLEDFEVRIEDFGFGYSFDEGSGDASQAEEAPRTTFRLDDGATQTAGNLTFTFTDADRDGKLSAGDSYSLQDAAMEANEAEESQSSFGPIFPDYQVVLYDLVADGPVNSGLAELPSPAWLALAALALAGLASRRR
ncbi:MAG: hypothetical protein QOC71_1399 [Thermoplasmata archaeon]|nr:hypothetical protein [Thermoplasmata archaeon]